MQHTKGRLLPSFIACTLFLAALTAPPSVFAETVPAPSPVPSPVPPPAPALPAPPAKALRIGVGRSQTLAEVTAPGGMLVIANGGIHWQSPPGQTVRLTLEGGAVAVSGLAARFTSVRLVPVQPAQAAPVAGATAPLAPANPLGYKGRVYRGEIEVLVSPKDGKLSVVNVVNVDEYLLGVVPREVSYSWPLEAIKAQSVAARTYALSHQGRWVAEGFDLVDYSVDQEYGGMAAERARTSEAVWATRGQVLTYGGRYASTFYHSSSGGHTENNEVIYMGSPIPYLRGVPDFDNVPGNTRYAWSFTFTPEELTRRAQTAGYTVGTFSGVSAAGAPGASGRPSAWSLAGALGAVRLTAQQLRTFLDLPSSPRSVTVQQGGMGNATRTYQAGESVAVAGPAGTQQQRTVRGTAMAAPGIIPVTATGAVTAVGGNLVSRPAGVVVTGGGWGHAVGMSQWGAYGMAQQGKTYIEILTHYYQGTRVETR